jgi:hypothetical protein
MLWVLSNEWPQALHSYSYVGTALPRSGSTYRIFPNIPKSRGIVKAPRDPYHEELAGLTRLIRDSRPGRRIMYNHLFTKSMRYKILTAMPTLS